MRLTVGMLKAIIAEGLQDADVTSRLKKLYMNAKLSRSVREMVRTALQASKQGDDAKALKYASRAKFSVNNSKLPDVYEELVSVVKQIAASGSLAVPKDYE